MGLVFKYNNYNNKEIKELVSQYLFKHIEYLDKSRIDELPFYVLSDSIKIESNIINILVSGEMDDLKTILRTTKLKKLINKKEEDIKYEFLEFWYNNQKNLWYMKPM